MARIMCTQTLWRRLGRTGRPPRRVTEPVVEGVALGNWAAKVFREDRRSLVIGLNERTYLTVVFPLAPRARFKSAFSTAVAAVLADLQLPDAVVHAESAVLELEPICRLNSQALVDALSNAQFICGIELMYQTDLRRVQLNLNEFPHPTLEEHVPRLAVRELFGRRNRPAMCH